jgi:hypothetical protein
MSSTRSSPAIRIQSLEGLDNQPFCHLVSCPAMTNMAVLVSTAKYSTIILAWKNDLNSDYSNGCLSSESPEPPDLVLSEDQVAHEIQKILNKKKRKEKNMPLIEKVLMLISNHYYSWRIHAARIQAAI